MGGREVSKRPVAFFYLYRIRYAASGAVRRRRERREIIDAYANLNWLFLLFRRLRFVRCVLFRCKDCFLFQMAKLFYYRSKGAHHRCLLESRCILVAGQFRAGFQHLLADFERGKLKRRSDRAQDFQLQELGTTGSAENLRGLGLR